MNKLENKNRQNRVPLSPLKSGLQILVSHFFYLISQKNIPFFKFRSQADLGSGGKTDLSLSRTKPSLKTYNFSANTYHFPDKTY